jgi:hypothetical protein|tara:strand:- start:6801 stop:7025 length:225 start_codon:yes stop_codon:yes gene_type:complete
MKEPLSVGPVSTGSLLSSSEGLSQTGLLGICTTVIMGDDPELAKWALIALGFGSGCYAIARALSKSAEVKGGKK